MTFVLFQTWLLGVSSSFSREQLRVLAGLDPTAGKRIDIYDANVGENDHPEQRQVKT